MKKAQMTYTITKIGIGFAVGAVLAIAIYLAMNRVNPGGAITHLPLVLCPARAGLRFRRIV